MQRFDDRRIIITGAGSGIGQATVARLLEEGGTVVAFDVSESGLAATAAAAEDAGTGKRLTTTVLDVSDEVTVGNEVAAAINTLDGLDVLVNVAAIQLCAHTHEHTLHDWNTTLAINLTGTFLMTRAALPALIDSRRGVVVNFTSTAATFAHPYMAAYAASKGGIMALTHSLALEYSKQGLRAVNIQPGGVSTALANSTLDKMPEGYDLGLWTKQTPMLHGRESEILGDPSAVAGYGRVRRRSVHHRHRDPRRRRCARLTPRHGRRGCAHDYVVTRTDSSTTGRSPVRTASTIEFVSAEQPRNRPRSECAARCCASRRSRHDPCASAVHCTLV
jgi:NAD(P)-dependent dehydrogenase (short-subunit alcohol dehydrogenase family)